MKWEVAATSIPATCCCSSGTTPPSSCAPHSPYSSPHLGGCFGRHARLQDVPVHLAARRLPDPTSRPALNGCLRRWVLPARDITSGAVTTLIQLLFSPHKPSLLDNCYGHSNTGVITVSWSRKFPLGWHLMGRNSPATPDYSSSGCQLWAGRSPLTG